MSTHDENKRLRQAIIDADSCIQEEVNYSNYDHETICRIGAMWSEASSILANEVERIESKAPPLPSDEPDSDGWIAWHGGECPVDPEKLVEAKLKDNERPVSLAKYLVWSCAVFPPIIAYRVIEPASDEALDAVANGEIQPYTDDHADEPTEDGVLSGAALHRAIADARDDGETPEFFEIKRDGGERWIAGESWTHLIYNDAQGAAIRRKPITRYLTAQDGTVYEWPEPMREMPEVGDDCYIAFTNLILWNNSTRCHEALAQGRCHATHEARNAHERALIAASGGTHE